MKKASKLSEDEIIYREMMHNEWKIKPSRNAVKVLEQRISQVLSKLGVDTTKDADSVKFQMETMDIFINSISEDNCPNASGLYISAMVKGELVPYAWISSAKVGNREYWFPIVYWEDEKYDEGKKVRLH